jgi:hypothetical protein
VAVGCSRGGAGREPAPYLSYSVILVLNHRGGAGGWGLAGCVCWGGRGRGQAPVAAGREPAPGAGAAGAGRDRRHAAGHGGGGGAGGGGPAGARREPGRVAGGGAGRAARAGAAAAARAGAGAAGGPGGVPAPRGPRRAERRPQPRQGALSCSRPPPPFLSPPSLTSPSSSSPRFCFGRSLSFSLRLSLARSSFVLSSPPSLSSLLSPLSLLSLSSLSPLSPLSPLSLPLSLLPPAISLDRFLLLCLCRSHSFNSTCLPCCLLHDFFPPASLLPPSLLLAPSFLLLSPSLLPLPTRPLPALPFHPNSFPFPSPLPTSLAAGPFLRLYRAGYSLYGMACTACTGLAPNLATTAV